ncbi:MAG TPA: hypothetical protein VGQ11_11105 [Candidatus Acidoferrales bacterium]|jgi:outer membrane biosynthesis protein TonB|nr:hypothetical protein [Candidatus Acidoferrales bacterium]
MLSPKNSKLILAITAIALVMTGACSRKRAAQAAPPLVIVPTNTQPAAPAPATETPASATETKPAETPPASAPGLVVPPAKKNSSRSAASKTAPAETPVTPPAETTAPKPAPPRMSPRISRAEQAQYEKKTNAAISAAEKNVQTAYGKQLNAPQNDMLEKIRGFLGQAREAMRSGDWQRAYNLAEKARVLSVELVNSL